MSGITELNNNLNSRANVYTNFKNNQKAKKPAEKLIEKPTNPEKATALKRPLKIDKNNNRFFINYKRQNKVIKIAPGEYNLTELRNAILNKVNESFGIGEVKVELTGSGFDRLIRARDSKLIDLSV